MEKLVQEDNFGESPFVGEDRNDLLNELLAIFDQVKKDQKPKLVSLEAPSGWGKTRIGHELYKSLASSQKSDPRYWPPSILSASSLDKKESLTPEDRRKRIFPEILTQPKGAKPEWFWWGIACQHRKNKTPFQSLAEDITQIIQHEKRLQAAVISSGKKIQKGAKEKDHLKQKNKSTAVGVGISTVYTLTSLLVVAHVPALGPLLTAGGVTTGALQSAGGNIRGRRKEAKEIGDHLSRENIINANDYQREELVEQTARYLIDISKVIPIVIFIEDLQEADESLVELLTLLVSAENASILILATSWLGSLNDPEKPSYKLFNDRRYEENVKRNSYKEGLDRQSKIELATLLLNKKCDELKIPPCDLEGIERFANHYQQPLALEIASNLLLVLDLIEEKGTLSNEDVEELPKELEDIYKAVWEHFPDGTKHVLTLAALSSPATFSYLLDGLDEQDTRWDKDSLIDAIKKVRTWFSKRREIEIPNEQMNTFQYGWERDITERLRDFEEPVYRHIALSNVQKFGLKSNELKLDRLKPYYQALAAQFVGEMTDIEQIVRYRILIGISLAQLINPDLPTIEAYLWLIKNTDSTKEGLKRRLIYIGKALDLLPKVQPLDEQERGKIDLELKYLQADAIAKSKTSKEAVEVFKNLFQQATNSFPNSSIAIKIYGSLAYWKARDRNYAEAISDYENILEQKILLYGSTHCLEVLETRDNIAHWMGQSKNLQKALELYNKILKDRENFYPKDIRNICNTKIKIANWTAESGDFASAIELYRQVLEQQEKSFDKNDKDVLKTRNLLALRIGQSGDPYTALDMYEKLLVDNKNFFGNNHLNTSRTKASIGDWAERCGDLDKAKIFYKQALDEEENLLGNTNKEVEILRKKLSDLSK